MQKKYFFAKRGWQIFYSVFTLSLFAVGILFSQSVFAARVLVKDGLQIQRALLHNAALALGHSCHCYAPNIRTFTISYIRATEASFTWDCSSPSTYQVRYGATAESKTTYVPATRPTVGYTLHTVKVTGLTPGTTYHVGPVSKCLLNCGGTGKNSVRTNILGGKKDWVFTTLKSDPVSVLESSSETSSAAISTAKVTDLTAEEVTISWTTYKPANSLVEYGLDEKYGSKSEVNSTLERDHTIQLFDLPRGTTFHARGVSEDSTGKTMYSPDFTFTTPKSEIRTVNRSTIYNEPNPCFERTIIWYYLYTPVKRVAIDILTLAGKTVATLEAPPSTLKQGQNSVLWDVRDNSGKRLSEGLYMYQIKFYRSDIEVEVTQSTMMVRK